MRDHPASTRGGLGGLGLSPASLAPVASGGTAVAGAGTPGAEPALPAPFENLRYRGAVSKTQACHMCTGDISGQTSRAQSRKCCILCQQQPDSFLCKENMTLFQISEEAASAPGITVLSRGWKVAGWPQDCCGFARRWWRACVLNAVG